MTDSFPPGYGTGTWSKCDQDTPSATKKDIPWVVPVISVAQSPSCSCYTHTGLNKSSLSSGVAELVVPGSHFLSAGRAREADLGRSEEEESEIAHYVSILLQPHIHCLLHPLLPFCHLPLFLPGVNTFPSCLIMFELRLGPVNQLETRAQKRGQGAPPVQWQYLTGSKATRVSPCTCLGQKNCLGAQEKESPQCQSWDSLVLGSYLGQLLEPETRFLSPVSRATWNIYLEWVPVDATRCGVCSKPKAIETLPPLLFPQVQVLPWCLRGVFSFGNFW